MEVSKNQTNKWWWLTIYLLTIFLNDRYGLMSMLGIFATLMLVFPKNEFVDETIGTVFMDKRVKRNAFALIFVFILLVTEFFLSYYLRRYRSEIFDYGGVALGPITIVNSFVIYVEIIGVLIYYVAFEKSNIFKINRRIVLFIAIMLFPFVVRECLLACYEVFISQVVCNAGEYYNLAYRAFVLAAFVEEVFYRGMVYDALKKYFSSVTAGIIQAMLFTFVHAERWRMLFVEFDVAIAINLFAVFLMGFFASRLRERTQSIVPGIIMHGALNAGVYDLFIATLSIK